MNREELQSRLTDFSVKTKQLVDYLKPGLVVNNITTQLFRSAHSSALNYAESHSAESRKDFVHKLSIVLV